MESKKPAVKIIRKYSSDIKSEIFGNGTSSEENGILTDEVIYNENGLIECEKKYSADGEEEELHQYSYNENKLLVQHHCRMTMDGVEETNAMERDAKGNVIKETKYYGDDAGETTTYTYNDAGKVTAADYYDEEGQLTEKNEFIYNEKGLLVKRVIHDLIKNLVKEQVFIYNENDLVSEQQEKENEKDVLKTIFQYDEKGSEISVKQYNPLGKITYQSESAYLPNGKPLKRIVRAFNTRIIDYEYDNAGNLLAETVVDETGLVLRRNNYQYSDSNRVSAEASFEMDLSRGGRDQNLLIRYEYEYF